MNKTLHTTWPQNPFPQNTSLKWPNFEWGLHSVSSSSSLWNPSLSYSITPNSPFPLLLYNCSFSLFPTQHLLSSISLSPTCFLPLLHRHLVGLTEFIVQSASDMIGNKKQTIKSACMFKSEHGSTTCLSLLAVFATVLIDLWANDRWHHRWQHPDIKMGKRNILMSNNMHLHVVYIYLLLFIRCFFLYLTLYYLLIQSFCRRLLNTIFNKTYWLNQKQEQKCSTPRLIKGCSSHKST